MGGVTTRSARGARAEAAALAFLRKQGLTCIDRNVRCRFGELDLVMRDGECLVVIEVRFRRAGNPLSAAASVNARKQHKLALTTAWYLSRHAALQSCPVRFDVVAIDGRTGNESALQWIKDAFRPGA